MTGALSLDDDEPTPGLALGLDEDDSPQEFITIKLAPDSPYVKMPANELQGLVVTASYKVTNVTDYDAGTQVNPGPAYREITIVEVKG